MAEAKALALPGIKGGFAAQSLSALSDLGVPLAVLGIVIALVTPLPSFVLDFLLVIDIMMSVIVLMVAMYIGRAVEFNVFPTTLLLLTLFRLALNVSTSRLILLKGNMGTSAAGHVIEAFGSFVVGGNYIIGTVIFLVLIAIQYVVINHGAVRISEVTARFTLDALPGKQMSIDADLNAGLIEESEARRRRQQLSSEAEFYGAMDGASRFTQRDAVASILITAINIIAGFLIGVFQHGMELTKALQTYTVLTIGDGLVTVIPALMISVSGGLIITRTSSDEKLGKEFSGQLFGKPQPLMLSGGVLTALSLFPGMPTIPFLLLGGGLGFAGWKMRRDSDAAVLASTENTVKPAKEKENIELLLHVDPIAVEVGVGLVGMVEGGQSSTLLQRIAGIRRQIASSLGFLLPAVKVNDNLGLRSREYTICLKGVEVARFELLNGHDLAIPSGPPDPAVEGRPTQDPAFGLAALWIPSDRAEFARAKGYTVVDATSVLGTHLAEVVRRHAHELFSRQDAKAFCDRVALSNPKVIEDLVPKLLQLAVIQRVLQNLLRERAPIRDGVSILEALGEAGQMTKNSILLTEYVRQAIRRALVKPLINTQQELPAYFLQPELERAIESSVEHSEQNSLFTMAPERIREIVTAFSRKLERPQSAATVLTSSGARHFLRQILESSFANVTVLSHNEIPPEVKVRSQGSIG